MPAQLKIGRLFIVSGPAGSGKTTLCDRMIAESPQIDRVVTSTTRAPREGEVDKTDYHFFDHKTFREKIDSGNFYEYATVHGNLYGTLKSEVQEKLSDGIDLLLNIDVQGAAQFREAAQHEPLLKGKIVTIFIMPPSIKVLEARLRNRGTDSEVEIQGRLQVAVEEMAQSSHYDHKISSASRNEDFKALKEIYEQLAQ